MKSNDYFSNTVYKRVIDRTLNYHRWFLPELFLAENAREWSTLVDLCEARFDKERQARLGYPPFKMLVEGIAAEWLDSDLLLGNLASLSHDPVAAPLNSWVLQAATSSKNTRLSDIQLGQTDSKHLMSSTCPNMSVNAILEVLSASALNILGTVVSEDKSLMAAGLDSLSSAEFSEVVSEWLSTEISGTLIFDHPTLNSISEFLSSCDEPKSCHVYNLEAALKASDKISRGIVFLLSTPYSGS